MSVTASRQLLKASRYCSQFNSRATLPDY